MQLPLQVEAQTEDAQLKRIFVNEKPFWIRKNLWKFLRIIRSKIGYLAIWADAICIDQSNLQERAQQVQMMGSIYRAARKVCAWLGEDAGQIGNWEYGAHLESRVFFGARSACQR